MRKRWMVGVVVAMMMVGGAGEARAQFNPVYNGSWLYGACFSDLDLCSTVTLSVQSASNSSDDMLFSFIVNNTFPANNYPHYMSFFGFDRMVKVSEYYTLGWWSASHSPVLTHSELTGPVPYLTHGYAPNTEAVSVVAAYRWGTDDRLAAELTLPFISSTVSTVPEPGTWMLMGTGLLALAGVGLMRRRSRSL